MDEITMARAVLGTASEPSPQVRAKAWASLERRLHDNDTAPRHWGRRITRSGLIATVSATAVVAAVTTVIVTASGQPTGRHTGAGAAVETASYVLKRAAAAQADAYHLIGVEDGPNTGSIYDGTTYADAATRKLHWVSYQRTPSGQPLLEESVSGNGSVEVDYRDRVYFGCTAGVGGGCAGIPDTSITQYAIPGLGQPGKGWQDPSAAYYAALAEGKVTLAGHRNLDGRDTILLRVHLTAHRTPQPPDPEVWVDARTYLMVQERFWTQDVPNGATVDPAVIGHMTLAPRTIRISWLQPTEANLAKLDLSPWAGFTQVNDHQLAQYLHLYG
jgi:hypothetical protein